MPAFLRTAISDNNLIRGAARLIAAPPNTPYPAAPASLAQLIKLDTAGQANEVQTITETGTPTGGTFKLRAYGSTTVAIPQAATAAEVQKALRELPSIGANVTVTGSAGGPFKVEFTGSRGNESQPLLEAAEIALTGGTTPSLTIVRTTPGIGQFDPIAPWFDLGATKTGVKITRNNTEDVFDVDQIYGDLDARPTNWEMTIVTALAEVTMRKFNIAWELGGKFTPDTTPTTGAEEHLGMGLPTTYEHRKMAVLYQRPNGLIRAFVFRRVVKMPVASELTYMKSGEQNVLPMTFRALVDFTVQDPRENIGEIIDQAAE